MTADWKAILAKANADSDAIIQRLSRADAAPDAQKSEEARRKASAAFKKAKSYENKNIGKEEAWDIVGHNYIAASDHYAAGRIREGNKAYAYAEQKAASI